MQDAQPPPPKKRRHPQLARAGGLLSRLPPASSSSSPPPPAASSPPPMDAREMQRQLEALVRAGVVESAEMLALLLLSTAEQGPAALQLAADGADHADAVADRFHARSFELFADLLVLKREFRRAIVRLSIYPSLRRHGPAPRSNAATGSTTTRAATGGWRAPRR